MAHKAHTTDNGQHLIKLGVIAAAHGIRGEVKIRSFTDIPEDIVSYGPLQDGAGKTYHLTLKGGTNDQLIASIKGIDDRNAAESLRNTELFVARAALPSARKNEYYYEDLAGLKLVTKDGKPWGTLLRMHNFGAGDLAEVKSVSSEEEYLPFNTAIFTHIDLANGTCVIVLPEIESPVADAPKDEGDE